MNPIMPPIYAFAVAVVVGVGIASLLTYGRVQRSNQIEIACEQQVKRMVMPAEDRWLLEEQCQRHVRQSRGD